MNLNVKTLKIILNELDDDVLLADLMIGNDDFRPFTMLKRLLLLESNGKKYLTINKMGSHFTGEGNQSHLKYAGKFWDEDSEVFKY